MRSAIFAILALAALVGCVAAQPQAATQTLQQDASRESGEYIFTLRAGVDSAVLKEAFADFNVREVSELGHGRWLVRMEQDPGTADIERRAAQSTAIEAVQPNFRYRR